MTELESELNKDEAQGSSSSGIVSCPICYSCILEPVVLPCNHEVCKECFEHSIETGNLCCPLCRKRFSSWARRCKKKGNIVDQTRKLEMANLTLQEQFKYDMYHDVAEPKRVMYSPGELQEEYMTELTKFMQERDVQVLEDLQQAKALQEREQNLLEENERQLLEDELKARSVYEKLNHRSPNGSISSKKTFKRKTSRINVRNKPKLYNKETVLKSQQSSELTLDQLVLKEMNKLKDRDYRYALTLNSELQKQYSKGSVPQPTLLHFFK